MEFTHHGARACDHTPARRAIANKAKLHELCACSAYEHNRRYRQHVRTPVRFVEIPRKALLKEIRPPGIEPGTI